MQIHSKRLDLTESKFDCLLKYIDFERMEKTIKNFDYEYFKKLNIHESIEAILLEKLNSPKEIEKSQKKVVGSFKATEVRTKDAKEKIQNAINILRLENKKIIQYLIEQTSVVSFTTVKNIYIIIL